jgi:hypothetical protein
MSGEAVDHEHLLDLAHQAVQWADQCAGEIKKAAGAKWYFKHRHAYMKARLEAFAAVGQLSMRDVPGCACDLIAAAKTGEFVLNPDCLYHLAARLQPDNHRIPWNCPTYWDGCNCDEPVGESA